MVGLTCSEPAGGTKYETINVMTKRTPTAPAAITMGSSYNSRGDLVSGTVWGTGTGI